MAPRVFEPPGRSIGPFGKKQHSKRKQRHAKRKQQDQNQSSKRRHIPQENQPPSVDSHNHQNIITSAEEILATGETTKDTTDATTKTGGPSSSSTPTAGSYIGGFILEEEGTSQQMKHTTDSATTCISPPASTLPSIPPRCWLLDTRCIGMDAADMGEDCPAPVDSTTTTTTCNINLATNCAIASPNATTATTTTAHHSNSTGSIGDITPSLQAMLRTSRRRGVAPSSWTATVVRPGQKSAVTRTNHASRSKKKVSYVSGLGIETSTSNTSTIAAVPVPWQQGSIPNNLTAEVTWDLFADMGT